MRIHDIDYRDDAVICRGFIAYDDTASSKRPGVLVFHEGLGLGEHIIERARRLRNSVTSRWQPTCSAIADRRGTSRICVDWSATFAMSPRSSAHAVVRRLQCLPHYRKSTRLASVR